MLLSITYEIAIATARSIRLWISIVANIVDSSWVFTAVMVSASIDVPTVPVATVTFPKIRTEIALSTIAKTSDDVTQISMMPQIFWNRPARIINPTVRPTAIPTAEYGRYDRFETSARISFARSPTNAATHGPARDAAMNVPIMFRYNGKCKPDASIPPAMFMPTVIGTKTNALFEN